MHHIHKKCGKQIFAHHGQDGFYCSGCDKRWSPDTFDEDEEIKAEEDCNDS